RAAAFETGDRGVAAGGAAFDRGRRSFVSRSQEDGAQRRGGDHRARPDVRAVGARSACDMSLADLHRHLDGSLRPSTVAELAARQGAAVPRDLAFTTGMGLEAALSKFAFLLSLIQRPAEVRRVAGEICEDAAAEGVTALEIRFAPQLHRGAGIEAIVDAALEGAAGRAGIVLCGLYGEPPEVLHALVDAAAS